MKRFADTGMTGRSMFIDGYQPYVNFIDSSQDRQNGRSAPWCKNDPDPAMCGPPAMAWAVQR